MHLLVVDLCDKSSIFAGREVQLQPLPELDIIKQCAELLHGANVTSLNTFGSILHHSCGIAM